MIQHPVLSAVLLGGALSVVGPTLDAHASEKTGKVSITKETRTPQIAEENPQIYEFLGGNISARDTNETIYRKLITRIESSVHLAAEKYSNLLIEQEYCKQKKIPSSDVLNGFIAYRKGYMEAWVGLFKTLEGFGINNVSRMNKVLIEDYWNQSLDNADEIKNWEERIKNDRKLAGYTRAQVTEAFDTGKIKTPKGMSIDYN